MRNKPHVKKNKGERCGAKTRSGTSCKNYAMPNGRCRLHGGKSTGAPPEKMKKNSNARTHGLFAKYMPEETLEIYRELSNNTLSPLDYLWENIKMLEAQIIRSMQIMHVKSKDEMIKEVKKAKENLDGREIEFEFQFAWDRQATFMNSLSRSMAELRNMLKQYVELSTHDDDRLLEVKRMQAQIDKTNAEIDAMNRENTTDAPPEITIIDEWTDDNEQ